MSEIMQRASNSMEGVFGALIKERVWEQRLPPNSLPLTERGKVSEGSVFRTHRKTGEGGKKVEIF